MTSTRRLRRRCSSTSPGSLTSSTEPTSTGCWPTRTRPDRAATQAKLLELAGVLGLPLERDAQREETGDAGPFIDLLLTIRQELRAKREFELADQIRDRLTELGVAVEDTAEGATWRWSR